MTILTPKMEAIVAIWSIRDSSSARIPRCCSEFYGLGWPSASSARCPMTLPIGSEPGDRRPLCSFPALSCFGGGAPRPLYRTYEDPQASLSNSYALTVTLPTGLITHADRVLMRSLQHGEGGTLM